MGDPLERSENLGESPAVEITGKIMIVAIVVLFMVVVFVLFLHLYAKWFSWRMGETTTSESQHRRRRRRFVFAPGQDPPNYGTLRRGLDPLVLRSLPVLVFESEEFKDGLECAVCLSEVVQGEKTRLLPKCNHGFHVDCIDMWFQSHSTCPLCRNPVASGSSNSGSSYSGSNDEQNASENNNESSEAENSGDTSPTFPTNVLIWGNQTQVSSIGASLEDGTSQPPCSSSSSAGSNNRRQGMLVIDIPSEINPSSLSPSASRFAEDELKSPMTARLRSLKRLLSRDKRLNPCSPNSIDVEQAGGAQS